MNPEEVARLYSSSRAGFDLVGYQEVGLPHWQLNVTCMVLTHKPIPPLSEFALRAIQGGLGTLAEIAGFLGLSERIATASMVPLANDGYIIPTAENPNEFALTPAGLKLLESCELVVPEETTFPLDYDGWTRNLVDLGNVIEYESNDLKKLGIWGLPSFPNDPPHAEEIKVSDVRRLAAQALVSRATRQDVIRKDILSIEGLQGKRHKFFIPAVALLFRSTQSNEGQVAFAVDGRLSEAHEEAFARAAGMKKLGVLQALKQSATDATVLDLDRGLLSQIETRSEVLELARQASMQKAEVVTLQEAVHERGGEEAVSESERENLAAARDRLARTSAILTQYPVRLLEVFEHPEILKEALAEATERLLVVSPWIRTAVVTRPFIDALEAALKRGVEVTIGYGINKWNPGDGSDPEAIDRLRSVANRYGKFVFKHLGDTHSKVLVLDHRYVVVTSFNWLSFRGDPTKAFRDERGVLVSIPTKIDEIYNSYTARVNTLAPEDVVRQDMLNQEAEDDA